MEVPESIELNVFNSMNSEEREEIFQAWIVRATAPSSEEILKDLLQLRSQIAILESSHKISSSEMNRRVRDGSVRETLEICHWRFLLELKHELESTLSSAPPA